MAMKMDLEKFLRISNTQRTRSASVGLLGEKRQALLFVRRFAGAG